MTASNSKSHQQLELLEEALGYHFQNRYLLEQALTHRSHRVEDSGSTAPATSGSTRLTTGGAAADNERLEFLGDAIVGLLVSEALYELGGNLREGKLSRIKSNLVSARHLYQVAKRLQLGNYLRLGPGEEKTGGREKKAILANAVEALVAAVYLDGGLTPARQLVRRLLLTQLEIEGFERLARADYKSALQEYLQGRGEAAARYELVATQGPEHRKLFRVAVWVGGECLGEGQGASKKAAELQAAQQALFRLYEQAAAEKKS